MKDTLINALKVAEINFLMSFKEIKPEIVTKQIQKDTNHIAWIIGHCATHFDHYLSFFTNDHIISKEEHDYFSYGIEKSKVVSYPYSFSDLIDNYLRIVSLFFEILDSIPESEFEKSPSEEDGENLSDMLIRITLHIMGHTGQIVLIRRMLDEPFWSFVGGVQKNQREKLRNSWISWWNENKQDYYSK